MWIVKDFLSSADIDAIHSLGPTGVRKEHDRYEKGASPPALAAFAPSWLLALVWPCCFFARPPPQCTHARDRTLL